MLFTPDPLQTLYLWALLFQYGGKAPNNIIKPELGEIKRGNRKITGKQRRNELEHHGLIEVTKNGKILIVTLTDKGWAWAASHLDAEVSPKAQAAGPILRAALTRLKTLLHRNNTALADLFIADLPIEADFPPLPARIRQTYFELSQGRSKARIRVADLIQALPDIDPLALKQALLNMNRQRELLLIPGENPRELSDADHQYAVAVAGIPNHFVRME